MTITRTGARRSFVVRGIVVATVALLALAGCSEDPLASQYAAGSGKDYVAGDGSVLEIQPANRAAAAVFTGVLDDGTKVSSADYLGHVTVLNFWYAACAPCRAEAPDLEALNQQYGPQGVEFVGVNLRDQAATAAAFASEHGVTYHSIIDANDANVQYAFAATVPAKAVPTTLVLDAQGRVAARILGLLESKSILSTLIESTLAEDAGGK